MYRTPSLVKRNEKFVQKCVNRWRHEHENNYMYQPHHWHHNPATSAQFMSKLWEIRFKYQKHTECDRNQVEEKDFNNIR